MSEPATETQQQNDLVAQYDLGDNPTPPAPPAGESPPAPEVSDIHPDYPDRRKDGTLLPAEQRAKKTKHSPRNVRLAKEYGLDDAEIEEYSPQDLRDEIRDRRMERLLEQRTNSAAASLQPSDPSHPEPAALPTPPVESAKRSPVSDLEIDPEWDERIGKNLNYLLAEINDLKKQVAGYQAREAHRENLSMAQRADAVFAKHEGTYGKGRGTAMKKGDANLARRVAVLNLAGTLDGDLEDRIEQAHAILYGKAVSPTPTEANDVLEERKKQWHGAALAKPTHRNGAAEPAGVEKATRTVEEILSQRGEQAQPASLDDFPA